MMPHPGHSPAKVLDLVILVLRTIMGTKKTVVYVLLVVGMSTITGLIYGALF